MHAADEAGAQLLADAPTANLFVELPKEGVLQMCVMRPTPTEVIEYAELSEEEMRASEETPQLKALYDGVAMTEQVLLKAFSEHGLVRLWPLEEKFDPNLHNALFEIPDPDKEAGIVAHVASVNPYRGAFL